MNLQVQRDMEIEVSCGNFFKKEAPLTLQN